MQNLGLWTGSFAQFSPDGTLLQETPSQLSLTLSENQQRVDLCLKRFPNHQPASVINLQFSYPGPGRQVPFLEQGAFSQGTLQYSKVSRFGAELSMIWGDRRLRLVPQYATGSQLTHLTLICETRADCPPSPPLTLEKLLGHWQGEAHTSYADGRNPDRYATDLQVIQRGDQVQQRMQFADYKMETTGQIHPCAIEFTSGPQPLRLLMLPGGGSSLGPLEIQSGVPFFLEAGWWIEPGLRQRLIRRYSDRGEWESLTLVIERQISPR